MNDALKVLKTVLSSAGVGQSDLRYLFDKTLERFCERGITKVDEWAGAAKILEDMVRVLDDESVINGESKAYIKSRIRKVLYIDQRA